MRLNNNPQLYDYLLGLSAELERRGAAELRTITSEASRHAAGMSTEFLGEARISLRRVQNEQTVLTGNQRLDLVDVLRQLDESFYRANIGIKISSSPS